MSLDEYVISPSVDWRCICREAGGLRVVGRLCLVVDCKPNSKPTKSVFGLRNEVDAPRGADEVKAVLAERICWWVDE